MSVATAPTAGAPNTTQDAVLDVRDLHITFPGRPPAHALRGASLKIAAGEIVGLVGESGSGKTLLGLAALGLLPPSRGLLIRGAVSLGGLDMTSAPEPERRARRGLYVGAVFQDPMAALNPAMRVGRQVSEAVGRNDPQAVERLLADAGIPEPSARARQYPHELSGGLRQRVMIAMAVAREPALVIADEPTTALDVTVQARVLDLLARLRERGMSVLLVTHDLAVAGSICDRIAVAYAGRIVESGPTAMILGEPAHPYTVGLLASRPTMDGPAGQTLASLPGRMPDPRYLPAGCAFAPRCPLAEPRCEQAPTTVPHCAEGTVECHRSAQLSTWPTAAGAAAATAAPSPLPATPPSDPSAHEVAISVHGVVRDFGGGRSWIPGRAERAPFRAVDDVTFELRRGGSMAVVGESGSGKTTLMRMIVGLLSPTRGRIVHGRGASPQLVFQEAGASLTPWLTVGQMLGERLTRVGLSGGERGPRIRAALESVGLPADVAEARPRQLSGGQRQRAAIARAVIVPPSLLVCDEPVSALDVSLAAQVLNLLGDLRAQLHLSLLFVTHDLAVARAVAEEVIVMQAGRVVEHGPVERVLEAPEADYTRTLLDAVPRIRGTEAT